MRFHKFYSQNLLTNNANICQINASRERDSNPQPPEYKSSAPPIELPRQKVIEFHNWTTLHGKTKIVFREQTRKLDSNQRLYGFADRCLIPLSHSELVACLSKPSSVFPLCLLLYGQELYRKVNYLFSMNNTFLWF